MRRAVEEAEEAIEAVEKDALLYKEVLERFERIDAER